jgi:hypothetical protein
MKITLCHLGPPKIAIHNYTGMARALGANLGAYQSFFVLKTPF